MSCSHGLLGRRGFSQLTGGRRPIAGGGAGNRSWPRFLLVLLVLFAIEGATLLNLDALLGVNEFDGLMRSS